MSPKRGPQEQGTGDSQRQPGRFGQFTDSLVACYCRHGRASHAGLLFDGPCVAIGCFCNSFAGRIVLTEER